MNKKHANQILNGIKSGDELEAARIAGDKRREGALLRIREAEERLRVSRLELMQARREWMPGSQFPHRAKPQCAEGR